MSPGQRHIGPEFVITAGDQAFATRTAGPASVVAVGSRVTAQRTLSVAADQDWDASGLPDLRGDLYVRRLKIEHRHGRAGPVTAMRAVVRAVPGRRGPAAVLDRRSRYSLQLSNRC